MRYATRLNSFRNENKSIFQLIDDLKEIDGLNDIDLNYPEHINGIDLDYLNEVLVDSKINVNGLALRFREDFIKGEFSNNDTVIRDKAIKLCFEAIDVTRKLNGKYITIWLGYDGFDYPFQLDYALANRRIITAFQDICDYAKEIKVSIEYKPYQPRVFSLISTYSDTYRIITDVNRSNIGATLDFCHMIMKNENPAVAVALFAEKSLLYGIHLNDGNKLSDDGLMVGSYNINQTLEFLYYIKKYNYQDVIYFDTFPIRENPYEELEFNIKMCNLLLDRIEKVSLEAIENVIKSNDALKSQNLIMKLISGGI